MLSSLTRIDVAKIGDFLFEVVFDGLKHDVEIHLKSDGLTIITSRTIRQMESCQLTVLYRLTETGWSSVN